MPTLTLSQPQLVALVAGLVGGLLCALGLWALARWRRLRRGAARVKRGHEAQREAATLLARWGYEVLDEEVPLSGLLEVDGERLPFEVRLDYLVRRGHKTFAVEVKSGNAADARRSATRRQLREYANLLEVDGLLLVDMERERVQVVRFVEQIPKGEGLRKALWLALGLCLGAAAALLWAGR